MILCDLQFNFYHNLIFVGILMGIVIGFLLLSNNRFQSPENGYLSVFLIAFSLNNLYYFLIDIGLKTIVPIIDYLPLTLTFLIPISSYMYLYSLLIQRTPGIAHHLYSVAIVQILFYLALLTFKIFLPDYFEHKYTLIVSLFRIEEVIAIVIAVVLAGDIIWVYLIQTPINSGKHYRQRRKWGAQFLTICLIIILLWIIPYIQLLIYGKFNEQYFYPLWSTASILVCLISIKAIVNPGIFHYYKPNGVFSSKIVGLSAEDSYYRKILKQLLEEEKIFKDPLDLKLLALKVGISPNKLSKIIKAESKNFYTLVNHFRVKEAKQLLLDPQFFNYTIEAIGIEAGFNSRASFFSTFKRKTNLTPYQYRKKHFHENQI